MKAKATKRFRSAMTLCILAVLIFVFCFSLAACSKKPPQTDTSTPSEVPEIVPPTDGTNVNQPSDVSDDTPPTGNPDDNQPAPEEPAKVFDSQYRTTARHGYYTELLGTVSRSVPETSDGGLVTAGVISTYPKYGATAPYSTEQKDAVIAESYALNTNKTANGAGGYFYFDKNGYQHTADGNFVSDGKGGNKKLFKHTAATSMYYAGVSPVPTLSDDEPAVVKRITFSPRRNSNSYGVTGLYAAPGELVQVKISKTDLTAVGGSITFHIGQCLYNGQNNNIWNKKNINRMPVVMNTLVVNASTSEYDAETDTYTAYIGSYLGGPIYLRHTSKTVTVTLSGAVEYRHFILGLTTEEEYARLSKSTAPYFDLEVWDNGVLHSGPVYYAYNKSYADIYETAVLWEKICLVSTQTSGQGIVMLYDPFVAAGAAVAFPGRSSTNCPASWMANALNARGFENSGAWGVLHEYNHNFQAGWGLPGGGEVTNNALNLASYVSFTQISKNRTINNGGMSGWNAYTNASWALKQVMAGNYSGTSQLTIYATLLHNVGAKSFVSAAAMKKGENVDGFYRSLSAATGYDYTYFFKELCNLTPSDNAQNAIAAMGKTPFIPVASVYQTGRSVINKDGSVSDVKTMRPFVISYGEDFTIDLRPFTAVDGAYAYGTVVLPENFTYLIEEVASPAYGSIVKASENVYTYTPDPEHLSSGEIRVRLKVKYTGDAYTIPDQTIDLILEFDQSHDLLGKTLERTVYTYTSETMYKGDQSPTEAFLAGFAGYSDVRTANNINTTQNSNTDIWLTNDEYNAYTENSILVVSGKIYITEDGDFRLALRGRNKCAVFAAINREVKSDDYDASAWVGNSGGSTGFFDNAVTYIDFTDLHTGDWIYFKEVLVLNLKASGKLPFVGLGLGKIEKYVTEITDDDENIIDYRESIQCTVSYATAYRNSYQIVQNIFSSEYLFERTWNYSYNGSKYYNNKGTPVEVKGFTPFNSTYDIGNAFDDNDNNDIHSAKGCATASNPFELTVDLGAVQNVNTMTIYGRKNRTDYLTSLPTKFTLYAGTSLEDMQPIATEEGSAISQSACSLVITFDAKDIRYYKLVVTETGMADGYICFRYIQLDSIVNLPNGRHLTPDHRSIVYSGDWAVLNRPSNFGRIYEGKEKSTVEFTFTGTRFAVFGSEGNEYQGYEVYIDDVKVADADQSDENGTVVSYLSGTLENATHTVKLVGTGKYNVDSVLIW